MYRKLILSLCLLFSVSSFLFCQMANKTKANFQKDATELIEYAFSEVGSIPGVSMSVVKDGKTVFEKGFGYANMETKLKMKENTSFYIASCTKAFTALLAAVLDKEGVISLDVSLASFFPKIKFDPALKADEIAVKSLLTHTSGLSNGPIGFRVAYSGEHTHEQLVQLLSASKPNKAGKGNYQYTNVGYNIYALIVQEVTGKSWQQLLQTKVFQPLGMKRTTAFMSKADKGNWPMALPYIGLDRDQYQAVYLLKKDNTMQSAGGLITTAADLGRWVNMQIQLGKVNGKQVFPKEIIQAAQTPLAACDEKRGVFEAEGYGYGWLVGAFQEQKAVWHSGGFPGYLSVMSFLPEKKIGVNVLINEPSAGFRLMYLLAAFSYDWWLSEKDVLPQYKDEVKAMATQIHKRQKRVAEHRKELAERTWQLTHSFSHYSGTYKNDHYGTITIKGEKDQLAVAMGNMHCVATPYTKANTARVELVPGSGEILRFEMEGDKIIGLISDGDLFKKVD